MLLLAGCSYVNNNDFPVVAFGEEVFYPKRTMHLGRSGAGNYYIARKVLENLDRADRVFILWSGLHRVDVSLPKYLLKYLDGYSHVTETRDEIWFHTGGFGGTWSVHQDRYPSWLNKYIAAQYRGLDWQYLNHNSLSVIAGCLAVLECRKIPYSFGFIYDIHRDYSGSQSSLGTPVDTTDPVYRMIPWNRCLRTTPFEFCAERGLLKEDGFHPTYKGYRQWWKSVRDQVPFELTGPAIWKDT